MRHGSKAREQIDFTEEVLAITAVAQNRLMALAATERDAGRQWQLRQAIADIAQAQRFWQFVTDYPYGR